jgi:hypothetical protein
MSSFYSSPSSSAKTRMTNSPAQMTLLKATSREFDHREKNNVYDRKLAREHTEMERKLRQSQKWSNRVEKNLIFKQIYNKRITDLDSLVSDETALTPSVDEWLEMTWKKRNASTSSNASTTSNMSKSSNYRQKN